MRWTTNSSSDSPPAGNRLVGLGGRTRVLEVTLVFGEANSYINYSWGSIRAWPPSLLLPLLGPTPGVATSLLRGRRGEEEVARSGATGRRDGCGDRRYPVSPAAASPSQPDAGNRIPNPLRAPPFSRLPVRFILATVLLLLCFFTGVHVFVHLPRLNL